MEQKRERLGVPLPASPSGGAPPPAAGLTALGGEALDAEYGSLSSGWHSRGGRHVFSCVQLESTVFTVVFAARVLNMHVA